MAGFENDVLLCSNVNFNPDLPKPHLGLITTNGQLIIGSSALNPGGTHLNIGTLISPSGTVTIGYSSPNITLDVMGGSTPVLSFNVDAATGPGTDPVVPTVGGQVTVTGGQVAAGTVGANVIRTHSAAANTWSTEIQRSTAVAASASLNNGVSHFDSAQFTVDANGFVQVTGTTPNPFTIVSLVDDFICSGSSLSGDTNWESTTTLAQNAIAGHPGVVIISNTLIQKNDATSWSSLLLGDGSLLVEGLIRVTQFSTHAFYFGLSDSTSLTAEPTDGCYFLADPAVNSGNWVGRTANGGSRSSANSAVPVALNTWYKLTITVNAAATSVAFFINDVQIAGSPLAANITANPLTVKFASTGANVDVQVDLFHLLYTLTNPRY